MRAAFFALSIAGLIVWLPLQILLITRLLRGEWRRYPLLFIFVVLDFLMGVADAPGVLAVYRNVPDAVRLRASTWLWIDLIAQVLLFAVVLSLISRAAAYLESRNLIRAACVLGALLFGAVSFLVHYDPHSKLVLAWMTPWTRDLNVCTTILDLALWFLLLGRHEKDRQLFLLSGALGIQFSGAAIGDSLRSMSSRAVPWPVVPGGAILIFSNLVRIYLWTRAFRPNPGATQFPKNQSGSRPVRT